MALSTCETAKYAEAALRSASDDLMKSPTEESLALSLNDFDRRLLQRMLNNEPISLVHLGMFIKGIALRIRWAAYPAVKK